MIIPSLVRMGRLAQNSQLLHPRRMYAQFPSQGGGAWVDPKAQPDEDALALYTTVGDVLGRFRVFRKDVFSLLWSRFR